jgi:flagellar biosynthesis protein FlhB
MSESAGEKKFDLSDKRRQQLREEGMVPKSGDVSTTVTLGVGLGIMVTSGGLLINYLREVMGNSFLQVSHGGAAVTPQQVGSVYATGLWLWLGGFAGAICLAALVSQIAQVGIAVAEDPFGFKFEKINPLSGLQNIFSINRLTQSGQSLVKLAIIASFAWSALKDIQASAVFSRPVSLDELGAAYLQIAWSFGWRIIAALVSLAAADLLWQRWKFNRDHRMTFEEVKEERKSMQASPEVMKRRRLMARKVGMRRMLENLKDATIVITNPTHYAVALKYRRGIDEVPIVVAKGIRKSALRIKEAAYDLRIAVRENKPLARGLYKYGRIDKPIPQIFYQGVAVVLASLFKAGFRVTEPNPCMSRAELEEIMNQDND